MPGRGRKWRSLENTAKIFPATSGKKDERVFRISCQMKEAVEPEKAAEGAGFMCETMPFFSVYCGADSFGTIWRKLI